MDTKDNMNASIYVVGKFLESDYDVTLGDGGDSVCCGIQDEKRARFIAEAFNVSTETGLTPKQLAERVKELDANLELQIVEFRKSIQQLSEQNKELLEALKAAYQVVLALSTDTDTPLVRQIESAINNE